MNHGNPFIIDGDKANEFLQEKNDKSTMQRIYQMAEKFEEIHGKKIACSKTVEFIEELIHRLENTALEHDANGRQFYADGYDRYAADEYIKKATYNKAIAIVKQLVEEYNIR